jgi:hypothetical protein
VINQDFDLVNAFGKDGDGQAGGDADIGQPELLNIASGMYDDTLRRQLEEKYPPQGEERGWIEWKLANLKKACAYIAFNPSEASHIDTVRTGKEDNQLAPADFEKIYNDNKEHIDQLLQDHPDGMPSFTDLTDQHLSLGANNPALWRADRWYQPNADAPSSLWQVLLENENKIESLDWAGLTKAREQALQDQNHPLYYAIDYLMTFGGELFEGRGEGRDLNLAWSDIESKLAGTQAAAAAAEQPDQNSRYRYEFSAKERSTDAEFAGDEGIELTGEDKAFLEAFIQDNKLDMNNDGDRQKLEDAFRARRYPNEDQEAFREFVELEVTALDTQG